MPEVVSNSDEGHTQEQERVAGGKTHEKVGDAHPGECYRQHEMMFPHQICDHSAREIGDCARNVSDRDKEAHLRVAQAQFIFDQWQQEIECGREPMSKGMSKTHSPKNSVVLSKAEHLSDLLRQAHSVFPSAGHGYEIVI